MGHKRTAVVLGGYGFIGSACLRALKADGFVVVGVGRSMRTGLRCDPDIRWLEHQIPLTTTSEWVRDLAGADVVINASGALQDGARDSLREIHETAVIRLVEALSGSQVRFIQISAAGVSDTAGTEFMRSKMRGDRTVMGSDLDWVILRPALVIGPQAFGGTALLRAIAGIPEIGLRVFPNSPVQTVSVEDVAKAVVLAARGEVASNTVADLTETQPHRFQDVVEMIRRWQGFAEWRSYVTLPNILVKAIARLADGLGWLGWRSPLRSTALRVLEDGVTGNPQPWQTIAGVPCRALEETLASMPSTIQERWFARLFLLLPVGIATLSLFWITSGILGLADLEGVETILTNRGIDSPLSTTVISAAAAVDIVLGCAILLRSYARRAAFGMVAISAIYLAAATYLAPGLWSDPFGPVVKVFPSMALALFVAAILEER